tara:strand:- start:27 stop:605 length:579 start_codon:yes stop_codon:yes gene_type:complete
MSCAGLFQGQSVSCADPLSVGLVQRLFLANLEDVASFTYDGTDVNKVTAIAMKAGKLFYEFEGVKQSINVTSEYVPKPYSVAYKSTIDFSVFEVDAATRRNLEAMAFQKTIAITFGVNDTSLSDGAFEIHGIRAGLDVITNVRIPSDNETGAAYRVQLASPDAGGIETALPYVFWDTDYDTTLAALVALKTV